MGFAALLVVPLVTLGAGTVGLKLEAARSEVDEWPSPRLEKLTADSLERTSHQAWAEHYLVVGDEQRGDVMVRGRFAALKDGSGYRFTWTLMTQECPPMSDAVGFDFKTAALSPGSLDAMSVALAKRAAKLFDKARELRLLSCIDPADLPPTPEELERMRIREQVKAQRFLNPPPVQAQPPPRPPPTAPLRLPPAEPPPPPPRVRPSTLPVRVEPAN